MTSPHSYIIKVELNLAYLLQVLRQSKSQAKESLFVKLFKIHPSPLVRREIILAMADSIQFWMCHCPSGRPFCNYGNHPLNPGCGEVR